MDSSDLRASLPLLTTAMAAIVLMIAIAIRRSHIVAVSVSLAGLAIAFGSLFAAASVVPRQVTRLLIVDSYALLYMALLLGATLFVLLFAYDYLERRQEHREEFYLLILLAATGAMVLVVSRHFVSFFLGLELLSVALYALISYLRSASTSIEAGLKYLILAAASSSALLFGLALIYAESGSMELAQFPVLMTQNAGAGGTLLLLTGLMLVLTGVGFKLAVVPFHLWTPDVYEGAPLPVTAFIATVSKGGMFALILRFFHLPGAGAWGAPGLVLTILAIASMLAGNLLALRQTNVKRILAYSSIAHMGYLLVPLLAGGALGASAASYYLAAYLATTLGSFGVMTALSSPLREAAWIDDYRGLFWRKPIAAGVFTAMLLSLAGIPLTAGFLGKFYIIAAGASQSCWVLLFTLVVSSTIGLFYYLRIIAAMFSQPADSRAEAQSMPLPAGLAIVALTCLIFLLGVYPAPLWDVIQASRGIVR